MRWLLALSVLVGIVPLTIGSATAAAKAAPPAATLKLASGTITRLDFGQVRVGRTTCSLSAKSAKLVGNFAVGEHVTIRCSGDLLRTIKLQPVTSGPAASVPVVGTPGPVSPPRATYWQATAPTSATGTHGQITSITSTTITIGDVTCSFPGGTPFLSQLNVGDTVSMTCSTYADGGSSAAITIGKTSPPTG